MTYLIRELNEDTIYPGKLSSKDRPRWVYSERDDAERAAYRMACDKDCKVWLYELIATCEGKVLEDNDKIRGIGVAHAMYPRWSSP